MRRHVDARAGPAMRRHHSALPGRASLRRHRNPYPARSTNSLSVATRSLHLLPRRGPGRNARRVSGIFETVDGGQSSRRLRLSNSSSPTGTNFRAPRQWPPPHPGAASTANSTNSRTAPKVSRPTTTSSWAKRRSSGTFSSRPGSIRSASPAPAAPANSSPSGSSAASPRSTSGRSTSAGSRHGPTIAPSCATCHRSPRPALPDGLAEPRIRMRPRPAKSPLSERLAARKAPVSASATAGNVRSGSPAGSSPAWNTRSAARTGFQITPANIARAAKRRHLRPIGFSKYIFKGPDARSIATPLRRESGCPARKSRLHRHVQPAAARSRAT